KVDEPDEDRAIRMMRGLAHTLEEHHKVRILDQALADAVRLSARYLTDRQLPDKCVGLLDTACARVSLSQSSIPRSIEDCRRELEHLASEIDILNREQALGADHSRRLGELAERKTSAEERLSSLESRWAQEKELVEKIRALRSQLESHFADGQKANGQKLEPEHEKRAREELTAL